MKIIIKRFCKRNIIYYKIDINHCMNIISYNIIDYLSKNLIKTNINNINEYMYKIYEIKILINSIYINLFDDIINQYQKKKKMKF
jgi:hypothetical protein